MGFLENGQHLLGQPLLAGQLQVLVGYRQYLFVGVQAFIGQSHLQVDLPEKSLVRARDRGVETTDKVELLQALEEAARSLMAIQLRQVAQTLLVQLFVVVLHLERHVEDVLILNHVHTYHLVVVALERQRSDYLQLGRHVHLQLFGEVLEAQVFVLDHAETLSDPLS